MVIRNQWKVLHLSSENLFKNDMCWSHAALCEGDSKLDVQDSASASLQLCCVSRAQIPSRIILAVRVHQELEMTGVRCDVIEGELRDSRDDGKVS